MHTHPLRMNLHSTINPVSINSDVKEKESKLDDVKFDFEDSDHIYDDPNLFTSTCSSSDGAASTVKPRPLDYTTPVPKLQPTSPTSTSGASCSAAKGSGDKEKALNDNRYTSLPGYATPKASSNPFAATSTPKASSNPFAATSASPLPPGYAAPRPSLGNSSPPEPPSSAVPKRPGYTEINVTPTADPTLASGVTAPKPPPGYAVPRPQSTGDNKQGTVETDEGKKENAGYFSLLQVTTTTQAENGAYQKLNRTPSTAKQGANRTREVAEEDEYVVMHSPS